MGESTMSIDAEVYIDGLLKWLKENPSFEVGMFVTINVPGIVDETLGRVVNSHWDQNYAEWSYDLEILNSHLKTITVAQHYLKRVTGMTCLAQLIEGDNT